MKKSVAKWIALLLSVVMIVMCAAGCGKAQTQEPASDNTADAPAQTADTPAQADEPEQTDAPEQADQRIRENIYADCFRAAQLHARRTFQWYALRQRNAQIGKAKFCANRDCAAWLFSKKSL